MTDVVARADLLRQEADHLLYEGRLLPLIASGRANGCPGQLPIWSHDLA